MIIQLNPQIPMHCPKGDGFAIAMIDYSQDHSILWVIAVTETGEIWTFSNEEVRAIKNISLNRIINREINQTANSYCL